jgi:hypothetical protein
MYRFVGIAYSGDANVLPVIVIANSDEADQASE